MDTPSPSKETPASIAQSISTQTRLKFKFMEISSGLAKHREISDEEWELIVMRYRKSTTLTNLETGRNSLSNHDSE